MGSPSYKELDSLFHANDISIPQSDIFIAPRPNEELYNNITDPDQFNSIAESSGNVKKLKELRGILEEWMKDTGDNIPENLTGDWYDRLPDHSKTDKINIRGEPVDQRFNSTRNNNKGRF